MYITSHIYIYTCVYYFSFRIHSESSWDVFAVDSVSIYVRVGRHVDAIFIRYGFHNYLGACRRRVFLCLSFIFDMLENKIFIVIPFSGIDHSHLVANL